MAGLSTADHRVSPPRIDIPRDYNAAHDLIERNLAAGRAGKTAYIDDHGSYSYGELAERVNRCANAMVGLGLEAEQRVLLCLHDSIDFPTAFLGCIKAGIVPIAANTLLTAADYEYMLRDSRAHALIVSAPLLPIFAPLLGRMPNLKHVVVSGATETGTGEHPSLSGLLAEAPPGFAPAATTCDDMCFWLYSSGSTGAPKGTVHVHSSMVTTAELYAWPILGIRDGDVVFSAAKLFFAYGLGNGLSFPLSVGATTVLMAERPTPAAVFGRLRKHQPTIFYGVPTLYAALLAHPELPRRSDLKLRRCASAGEALPADIGKRWTEHFGVEILDGLGSTEMLHIFLSNRPGAVRYGTSGTPVPGYEMRIVGDDGNPVASGQVGELQICGPTSAMAYWNNRQKSRDTFQGPWTRSGDKYSIDPDGYYVYAGRTDDMLKVSGIYVSPVEVESALITHAAVLEAAVIGKADEEQLVKPLAYVVLKPGHCASAALADELRHHVKARLAPYKYPRWIEFIDELPKTATGKIQRFKLRQRAA
ncbi:MAG: benzoate-CoA ligase family protein [Betaproteobacteria bacterium]|nr:MAG: benzoate-CoA ligase family protein [Betaproteobacteria bacterium]